MAELVAHVLQKVIVLSFAAPSALHLCVVTIMMSTASARMHGMTADSLEHTSNLQTARVRDGGSEGL